MALKSITIPNSLRLIDEQVFYGCEKLSSIHIPTSVTLIGNRAFQQCDGLTSIEIPDSISSIGRLAFEKCRGLTSIAMPNSVTAIGLSAFKNCSALTSVTIPHSLTRIETAVFRRCVNITRIEIPNSITSIGDGAFLDCKRLSSIDLPTSVVTIERSAFSKCSGLSAIDLMSTSTLGEHAFAWCANLKLVIATKTLVDTIKVGDHGLSIAPVVSTPASRLQLLRLKFWSPASHVDYSDARKVVALTVMLVGLRCRDQRSSRMPSLPTEMWMFILRRLRPCDIGQGCAAPIWRVCANDGDGVIPAT
jgi:hypothetical protein